MIWADRMTGESERDGNSLRKVERKGSDTLR